MKKAETMRRAMSSIISMQKILNTPSGKRQDAAERNCGTCYFILPGSLGRIERLEKEGYITGYQVKLNPALLGYPIKAFINLEVEPVQKKEFYPYIEKVHNVVECNCVTGDYSMLIEGLFVSTIELDQFIGELQHFGRTRTQIVFSTSVEHRQVTAHEAEE